MNLPEKLVESLLIGGTHTPDDMMEALKRGEFQVWQRGESLLMTSVNVYPRLRVCDVALAAGDLEEIWDLHDNCVIPFAREKGCGRIMGRGRPGWAREARKHGYSRDWIMASKEI